MGDGVSKFQRGKALGSEGVMRCFLTGDALVRDAEHYGRKTEKAWRVIDGKVQGFTDGAWDFDGGPSLQEMLNDGWFLLESVRKHYTCTDAIYELGVDPNAQFGKGLLKLSVVERKLETYSSKTERIVAVSDGAAAPSPLDPKHLPTVGWTRLGCDEWVTVSEAQYYERLKEEA